MITGGYVAVDGYIIRDRWFVVEPGAYVHLLGETSRFGVPDDPLPQKVRRSEVVAADESVADEEPLDAEAGVDDIAASASVVQRSPQDTLPRAALLRLIQRRADVERSCRLLVASTEQQVREFVVLDARLEYASLLQIDEVVEVQATSWHRDDDGFMVVPSREAVLLHGADQSYPIANEWFAGMRYACDVAVRKHFQFSAFDRGALRAFLIPIPAEAAVRCIVVADSARLTPELLLSDKHLPYFFAHCYLLPPAGEWPVTKARVVLPTRTAALYEATTGEMVSPAEAMGTSVHPAWSPAAASRGHDDLSGFHDASAESDRAGPSSEAAPPARATPRIVKTKARSKTSLAERRGERPAISVAIPETPSPAEMVASSFGTPRTPAGLVLYPHQRRTVRWMMQREAEVVDLSLPLVRTYQGLFVDEYGLQQEPMELATTAVAIPPGGLVAHPVGSGKTVMTAALIGRSRGRAAGATLVLVPDHIVAQWIAELARFVPDLIVTALDPSNPTSMNFKRADVDVCIAPHSGLVSASNAMRSRLANESWFRIVIDEAHEVDSSAVGIFISSLTVQIRWLLTATPQPLQALMTMVLGGAGESHERIRAPFLRTCTVRDAAADCLPVPPLEYHMMPVVLSWQETSVLHAQALAGNLQATVRLASYFAELDSVTGAVSGSAAVGNVSTPGSEIAVFGSLDEWVARSRTAIADEIARLEAKLESLEREIAEAMAAVRAEREAAVATAEAALALKSQAEIEADIARALAALPHGPEIVAHVVGSERCGRVCLPRAWEASGEAAKAVLSEFKACLADAFLQRVTSIADGDGRELESCQAVAAAGKVYVCLVDDPRTDWTLRAERRRARMLAQAGVTPRGAVVDTASEGAGSEVAGVDAELVAERDQAEAGIASKSQLLRFMDSVSQLLASEETECSVCFETMYGSTVTMLPCLHPFCATCVMAVYGDKDTAECPMCRAPTPRRTLCTFECVRGSSEDAAAEEAAAAAPAPFRGSKVAALTGAVQSILASGGDDKIVVFGQWASLLEQIACALDEAGVLAHTLEGTMAKRGRVLEQFREGGEDSSRVLLLSLESHASGINLDMANHVFIVHPYVPGWAQSGSVVPLGEAQAFERQAVGRVHRFPQSKVTHVYRLYARGSVEEEMYHAWGWA
ncbi:chromatin remodeling complex subunit [Thecamonas trahens ATCC 50062]|uniref:Chromatin remodeling complex subunit n=1 Tax=Thecamonas trahens ATCC 50062 TaxID=461836 RepID=A0A0L0D787_THETB|nr:chromatin remodeling complex subunit [Thecamonas trahens ATCC 50062]KNC47956.1 chromatin remodeling complex subunit [Thecamonas trahens ATCC 50062]|eukprot:XP_013758973.1 chromatin remodeling complex subunit [Thecamonas trahens ATCC 50062]